MKVSLNWLREILPVDLPDEALASRLTMAGLEVEDVSPWGGFEQVVAARIVGVERHPGAERLTVCVTDAGAEGTLRVVCGAPNVQAGLCVPLALPGARLADGRTVSAAEVRGVVSLGVLVSERELGLSDDHSGVMTLPGDTAPGTPLADVLGLRDTLFEVSITPNRGDCMSVLGIARELSALLELRLRPRPPKLSEKPPGAAEAVHVEIHEPETCRRYVARIVRGVRIGPSPLWLRSRLESCGIRSINNVVDVTNYVLLERGQPLHAFDLARIAGGRIVVRRAGAATRFRTLDGVDRALEADDLVVADAERAVALAGVMGGEGSAVGAGTVDVLLESAFFAPGAVRRTSRRLGLRSESSIRFERTVDIEGVPLAADRAAELLQQLAGGQVAAGRVDVHPNPLPALEVLVRIDRANRLLGTEIPVAEVGQILRRVSAGVKAVGKGGYLCRPPAYRSDLTREADFIEEIARLAGYDRIPATRPHAAVGAGSAERRRDLRPVARSILIGEGATEMECLRFTDAAWNARIPGLSPANGRPVRVLNPMSGDAPELRQSLLPGLLAAARRNRHLGEPWLRAFEIGTAFWVDDRGKVRERTVVAGIARGPRPQRGLIREDRAESFHDAKGIVEALLAGLRLPAASWGREALPSFLHPGKAAHLTLRDDSLGFVGGLHPETNRAADLEGDCWVFELDLEKLGSYASRRITFEALPKYPAVVRDLAIVADESFEAQAVLDFISRAANPSVESVRLFDVYRGAPLPAGKKSLAYTIAYRSAEGTLTDEEVNAHHQLLVGRLTGELAVELRS